MNYLETFTNNNTIDAFVNSLDNDIIVLRTGATNHPFLLRVDGDTLYVHTTSDMAASKSEVTKIFNDTLSAILGDRVKRYAPAIAEGKISFVDDIDGSAQASQRVIMGDYHASMYESGIKPLAPRKKDVEKLFVDLGGYDISMYVYTDIVLDNTVKLPTEIKVTKSMYQDEESQALLAAAKAKVAGTEMTDQTKRLLAGIKSGIERNILMIGEPGSGKSFAAQQISAELGIPLVTVNGHSDVSADLLIGGYRPVTVTDSDEVKQGGAPLVRYDGSFVEAYSKGYIYSFEEPNYTPPAVLGRLNNALDFVGELVLEDGTRIKRHPNFIFIASVNPHLAGTQPMNDALINRMHATYVYETPTAADFVRWAEDKFEYTNKRFIEELHSFLVKDFKALLYANGSSKFPSFRGVEVLLPKLSLGVDFHAAMNETFVNPVMLDLSDDQYQSVLKTCKGLFNDLKKLYVVDNSAPEYADLTIAKDFLEGDYSAEDFDMSKFSKLGS